MDDPYVTAELWRPQLQTQIFGREVIGDRRVLRGHITLDKRVSLPAFQMTCRKVTTRVSLGMCDLQWRFPRGRRTPRHRRLGLVGIRDGLVLRLRGR
jgi:hypothetical protein